MLEASLDVFNIIVIIERSLVIDCKDDGEEFTKVL